MATWSITKLLHSAQEMGKGLRERWAVGKEECVSGIEKRVIFGGARVYQDFGEVESDFDTGALRNICSLKEFGSGNKSVATLMSP